MTYYVSSGTLNLTKPKPEFYHHLYSPVHGRYAKKIIMNTTNEKLNNLTKQNVCVQYPVLQRYIFQTVCI